MAGGGGAEAEDALGAHDGVGGGAAGEEPLVVVAFEFACVGIEDAGGPGEGAFVEGVEHVGGGEVAPDAPHPPADARGEGGHGALDAAADRFMSVVDVVGARGDDDGGLVLLDDGRELGGDAVGGVGEVGVRGRA